MSTVDFGSISPRTAAYAQKQLLTRAIGQMVFERWGQSKEQPGHMSKTSVFRRYNSLSTTPMFLVEGVTPAGQPLTTTDVTVTLGQMGGVVNLTDIVLDTHEDPVLQEVTDLLGEQAGQQVETMRYGILKAGTNVVYANGATRAAVNTPISLAVHRKATKALKRQNAQQHTKALKSTPSYKTEPVAKSYIGFVHPDLEADYRNMVGADGKTVFIPVEKYGSMSPYENEIGSVEGVRLLTSTILVPFYDAGGAKGLMTSSGGVNTDVYPVLYCGANAYGVIALKGKYSIIPMICNPVANAASDPLAQKGSAGWKTMQAAVILNDAWMVRLEVGVTA